MTYFPIDDVPLASNLREFHGRSIRTKADFLHVLCTNCPLLEKLTVSFLVCLFVCLFACLLVCFVLFCFVLFCFAFVLFCFVLFCLFVCFY